MKNLNLFFQVSTLTSMLVASLFTLAVAQNADDKPNKQKITIDIEVIENGEVKKISKEVDASEGENIHEILRSLDIMDDLDITGTGERLEIKVKKEKSGATERHIDVEVRGSQDEFQWFEQAGKIEKRALLGVYPATYDADGKKGALVNSVVSGSGAEKAGLKQGDIITHINDEAVTTDAQLRDVVQSHKPGETVTVKYFRNGDLGTKQAVLGETEDANVFIHKQAPHAGANSFHFKGDIEVEEMLEKMRKGGKFEMDFDFDFEADENGAFLGVTPVDGSEGDGVELGSVVEGTAAERMGLKPGDRVLRMDGAAVNDFDGLAEIISSKKAGDKIDIDYQRDGKTVKTTGELGKRADSPRAKKIIRYNNMPCDVGTGAGPWSPEVIKEVRVVIEMTDCSKEEEELLAPKAKVDFNEELALNRIEFAPNPSNGQFNLEFELPEQKNTRILIFDQSGRKIQEQVLSNFDGFYKDNIDISSQPNGVYFLIIAQGEKQFTRKIVKQ